MSGIILKNILGVVVLYNCEISNSKTISSINDALEYYNGFLDVLVYDNSPERTEKETNLQYKRLNIHYVHCSSNDGVSKAYNYGAKYGKEVLQKKWILLLDQDTLFANDLFLKFIDAQKTNHSTKLFSPILMTKDNIIFSPCRYFFGRGFPLKSVVPGITSFKNTSPVNSGMLIDLTEFFKAGMYNDKIKLDFSDFQFIERFKKIQSVFFVINSIAYQDFSNHETDINKLNVRYSFFCAGAKNFEKSTILDEFKYFIVAFMRAVTLSFRTKSLIYFLTFFNSYIN